MNLRFSSAGTNCPPAHQVCQILGRNHIQELTGRRQPAVVNLQQQLARNAQTVVNLEAVIHVRIVNQPFPANGGARFFKIDAHHDFQLILQLFTQGEQTGCVFFRGSRIVDRAWANHHQKTIVITFQDLMDRFTSMRNRVCGIFSGGEFLKECYRR